MVPSNIPQSKDSSEIEANVSYGDVSSGIVQEVANGIQDPPLEPDHGDWLVVTRSRKSNQNRGKGKAPFKENKSSRDQGIVFKKVNDQNTKVTEKSSGTSPIKKDYDYQQ
ncbi:ornithine cyclodeaminase family protein [Sesbania bispinosa]|nr:ornithine cyclodeaminase family protein [Sesbania bispinosa]